jgi:hypothetical protein
MSGSIPFQGGKHWLRPPLVSAPSADDRSVSVAYTVSEDYMTTLRNVSRLSEIFQVWVHVVGEPPPINNISRIARSPVKPTLTTLADSVACFRGVKRPYTDQADGGSILVYVLNPTVTLERDVNMVCLARAARVPASAALTVQVVPVKQSSITAPQALPYQGIITRLEFVVGEGNAPVLPKGYTEERYETQLW